jgi:proteasome alpha subunit
MSMPFYVSPEQLMKDRADFARKGIARGRSVVVVQYADGIVFVSENPSQALHKISEIYDRIAFAAVGRYNEFENLRIAGVRLADMRGYAYDRRDVTGRGLANAYAQTLGTIFSSGGEKPYEVEIFVAEVGDSAAEDQVYRLTYDGQIVDEHGFAVMGGSADTVTSYLKEHYTAEATLADAVRGAVAGLEHSETTPRVVAPEDLEVAVLDRSRSQQRKFKRLSAEHLVTILGERKPAGAEPEQADAQPAEPVEETPRATPPQDEAPTAPPVAPPVPPPTHPPTEPTDPAQPPVRPEPEGGQVPPPDNPDVHPPVDPGDPVR